MSATNRGGQRNPADYYATPAWCVRALLDAWRPPRGIWCDPCAGDGAIIRAAGTGTWTACELREECRADLEQLRARGVVIDYTIGDFLGGEHPVHRPDVIITNPPYCLAREFISASLEYAHSAVAMLLRLNFLGSSSKRLHLFRRMPDVYVLSKRPSFTGGGTDACEYAWFVWRKDKGTGPGALRVI
jgi:hypothetical protein